MLKQRILRTNAVKSIRLLQLVFILILFWFFFWAHIYEMLIWDKTFIESFYSSIPNVLMYTISLLAIILLEIYVKRTSRVSTTVSYIRSAEELRLENEELKHELLASRKVPSSKIGIAILAIGLPAFVASIMLHSSILAFIGLGLTFWGVLFFFAKSTKFVRSTILDATAISFYITLDRIIDDLGYKGRPIQIPPYPKKKYLPNYLEGLKEFVVFISSKKSTIMPSIEEMAKKQFLLKNTEGICITSPGSRLVNLFEKEVGVDFIKINKEDLYESLSKVIVNNLELANRFEITTEQQLVHVKIINSIYSHLYYKEQKLKSVYSIGCPLISAVACALAITTGKPITITRSEVSPKLGTIDVFYQIVEG